MINVPNTPLLGQICLDSYIYDPIGNPMEILKSFFRYGDLQDHLKKLKQWKTVVTTQAYFEIDTLSNPLYDHKMMCNLVNAGWLLVQGPAIGSLVSLPAKEQEFFLNRESLNADFYVKHLSASELIDPFGGIKNFYESFTLQESHQQLYEWLNTGLSPNVIIADEEMTASFYKSLRKLLECCWLVFNRRKTIDQVSENLDLKENSIAPNTLPDDVVIPPAVLSGFKQFLSIVPAQRLNRGLRKMLVDYLFYNMNGLPTDFEETLADFYWLTDLLDEIQGKNVDAKFM